MAIKIQGTTVIDDSQNATFTGSVRAAAGTTNMTNGFIYIPAAAGAPTGAATTFSGRAPLYFDSANNKLYAYNNTWIQAGGSSGASVTVDTTPPVSPSTGSLWWDSENGNLYIYYNDVDTGQWVAASGPQGLTGPQGEPGQDASLGKVIAMNLIFGG